MTEPEHGRVPLYRSADGCGHDESPEPDAEIEDADAWSAYDAWHDNHPPGHGNDGERICLLTPDGWACPACSEIAREEGQPDAWVECQLAGEDAR